VILQCKETTGVPMRRMAGGEGEQMDDISFAVFTQRMNHRFVLRRQDSPEIGEPIAALLVECSSHRDNGRSTSYSVTFRAPLPVSAEQGTYLVEADSLTPSPIFLVPVRQTADGVDFHAVFNQLTEDANAL
jgi:hypothetical protein